MWDEYKDLTPEERLDIVVEILTEGVLRLIEKKKALVSRKKPGNHPKNNSAISSKKRIKDVPKSP
jgi:hypothetical protein